MTFVVLAACTCAEPEPGRAGREFESRADARYPGPPALPDGPLDLWVASDADDGTLAGGTFRPEPDGGVNRATGEAALVLWFDVPEGVAPVLAKLHLPVVADGTGAPLEVRIRGLSASDARTGAAVTWTVPVAWPDPYAGMPRKGMRAPLVCAPFERATPDLQPLVAELGPARRVGFVLEAVRGELRVLDRADVTDPECEGPLAARLELFPTVRSTFLGKEMLVRPTDRSVVVSMVPALEVEVAVDFWSSANDRRTTEPSRFPAERPIEIALAPLQPATAYRWQVRWRRGPDEPYEVGPEHTFHTARAGGEPFTFTVTSDGHYLNMEHRRAFSSMHLLKRTMERVGAAEPDFHVDLGDVFNGESYRSYDAPDDEEMARRALALRPYFELADAPVFVVPGNHEGEQGWRVVAGDGLPDRARRARDLAFPSPVPGDFVTGGRSWYAFRWGDVLVVVLDPYSQTLRKPHDIDGVRGSGDRWDWTLGREQYDWLVRTLEESDATFELVMAHQVTGGTNEYGRGGREAAQFSKKRGSYEWGGRDPGGADVFDERRPGWGRPVHQVLSDAGVTAFVHGHDHVFAYEPPLDGVAYVTVPQPGDARYEQGHAPRTGIGGDAVVLPNSGFLQFTAGPGTLDVAYVRSFLPGDGPDGEVAFRTVFTDCDGNGVSDHHDVARGRPDADRDGRPDECH